MTSGAAWCGPLGNGAMAGGLHTLNWDGADEGGQVVPTGMYLVRLTSSAGAHATKRMVFFKVGPAESDPDVSQGRSPAGLLPLSVVNLRIANRRPVWARPVRAKWALRNATGLTKT